MVAATVFECLSSRKRNRSGWWLLPPTSTWWKPTLLEFVTSRKFAALTVTGHVESMVRVVDERLQSISRLSVHEWECPHGFRKLTSPAIAKAEMTPDACYPIQDQRRRFVASSSSKRGLRWFDNRRLLHSSLVQSLQ